MVVGADDFGQLRDPAVEDVDLAGVLRGALEAHIVEPFDVQVLEGMLNHFVELHGFPFGKWWHSDIVNTALSWIIGTNENPRAAKPLGIFAALS